MKGTAENIMKHPGTPLVSVIIPVYNTEDYLRQCLDSAVHQTLRDIEIICINDGSTDHSLAILEEYQAIDPRVAVISQENRGLSAARNCGMKKAKGKYIYFLDSDDYADPETLKRSTELAEKNDLDAVVFGFEQFADDEKMLQIHPFRVHLFDGFVKVYSGTEYMKSAKDCEAYSSPVWTAVWRRAFLEKNGLRFVEGILHEDMLFSFQAYMAADRVMAIPERLYHYRARPDSICTKPISAKNVIGSFECAKGVLKYVLEGEHEPDRAHEIWRAYRELSDYTASLFSAVSAEEQTKTIPPGEMEGDLFRQMISRYQADRLQEALAAAQEETGKLRKTLGRYQEETDRLEKTLGEMQRAADRLEKELEEKQRETDRLEKTLGEMQSAADRLEKELAEKQKETDGLREALFRQRGETAHLQEEIGKTYASWTYRIGHAATWLPRKVRDGVRRYKEKTQ